MRIIALYLFLALNADGAIPSKLISKVVGVAGKYYLTSREVEINAIIEHYLYDEKSNLSELTAKINPEGKDFYNEVNAVLLEYVVYFEAEQFTLNKISDETVNTSKKNLEKKFKVLKLNSEVKATPAEIEKVLRKKLVAKQFIRFKVDSSYVPVTDAEAEDYYRKNPKVFAGVDFKQKKEEIKASLSRKRVDQRLQEWFGILQKKYGVRNYISAS